MLDLQVGWYLNIKSWLENSQNYFDYSPILIGSIFTIIYELWKTLSPFRICEPCQDTHIDSSYKNLSRHKSL